MKIIRFIIVSIIVLFAMLPARADITTVTAALIDSPTTLSDGRAYFLAGVPYQIRVQAEALDNTVVGDWSNIIIQLCQGIPPAHTVRHTITYDFSTASSATCEVTASDNTSSYSNIDVVITFTPHWNLVATTEEFAWSATNSIVVTVNEVAGTPATLSNNISPLAYGMCSSIQVRNFTQGGDAADGRINPYHNNFNVTGQIAYYVAGQSITDLVTDYTTAGEIISIVLLYDGTATGFVNTDGDEGEFSFTITSGTVALGDHNWRARANMTTGAPITEDSVAANQLDFNCDRVNVTGITFINGGGIGPTGTPPRYYRSTNFPGTRVVIDAEMDDGGTNVIGNTTFTIYNITDASTLTFTVQVNNGDPNGSVIVDPIPAVGINTTELKEYRVQQIDSDAYGTQTFAGGQISQPADLPGIYWDNQDPPGNNEAGATAETMFTTFGGVTPSAASALFEWTPVSSLGDPPFDGDFYTYRIYYKEESATTWTMVDRSVAGFGPADTYDLSDIDTGEAIITGLTPLTPYHYYITAVDVFGQEVETSAGDSDAIYDSADRVGVNPYALFNTTPFEITVKINDGIQTWVDDDFDGEAVPVPANRSLRESQINVRATIVSATGQPDSMNLILADFATDATNLEVSGALNSSADYDVIAFTKLSNEWHATIPTTNRFMGNGRELRFILEIIKDGVSSFTDHDADFDPEEDPTSGSFVALNNNDMEWTFSINTQVQVKPWPVRVLNNVITKKNPRCYPAYYLTHDAKVTIRVYDVKGRPVVTLIDNASRKGGQNIRERGWNGVNKARKKLGPGLYYIHFYARKSGSKKVILNEFRKVVIAR